MGGVAPRNKASKTRIVNWDAWYKRHCRHGGCFIQIKNQDKLCLARAVDVSKSRIERHPKWDTIRQGIAEVEKIQNLLAPQYQIKVYSKEHANALIYKGPHALNIIHLYFHHNHFDVITRMPACMGNSYYCDTCHTGYNTKNEHECNRGACRCCDSTPECVHEECIYCVDCNRYFQSQACFDNHKHRKPSKIEGQTLLCQTVKRCNTCKQILTNHNTKSHICGCITCPICMEKVKKQGHVCYMKQIDQNDKTKRKAQFIFFDFETEPIRWGF